MKNSYKNLSYKELVELRDKKRKELVDLRMQKVLAHMDNPNAIKTTRHEIARLNTRIHAIDIGLDNK